LQKIPEDVDFERPSYVWKIPWTEESCSPLKQAFAGGFAVYLIFGLVFSDSSLLVTDLMYPIT
jgi:hypothetical protein